MSIIVDVLHNISKVLPEVKAPVVPPSSKERLMWTGVALILYFIMYHVTAFGITHGASSFDFLQTITASRFGSLLTAGIGPIVLASIFLQLFVGAGLINLNLQDKVDRQKFHEVQKVLAILLAFVEASIFVVTGASRGLPIVPVLGDVTIYVVILQIAFGSIILLYLDEIVSKYGVGSGISLFIAGGVALIILNGSIQLIFAQGGVISIISEGGAEALPQSLLILLPVLFTVIVFFIAVYAEGVKVEIPIAFERVRGLVPRLPLKYFYVSNIPVIFASALIQSVILFSAGILLTANLPWIGSVTSQGRLQDGLLYLITPPYAFRQGSINAFDILFAQSTPIFGIPEWLHAIFYILFLSFGSILFGIFWVETSNMDAKSVANQLNQSGMQIPGFRRDPRMLEQILNKHIFPLTVLGSFSVGLLAGFADLTGALGSGTGILLTVGILYRMYEQMEQMQMFEMYPMLGKIAGN